VVTQTVLVFGRDGSEGPDTTATVSAIGSLLAGMAAIASFAHGIAIRRRTQEDRRSDAEPDGAPEPNA
jgi:hypothetical protein